MMKTHRAGFLKKISVFPKFGKICRKSDLFRSFSKSALTISFAFWIQLEDTNCDILSNFGENRQGRSRFTGPKRPKNGYFLWLISRERKELSKICVDFRNPQAFFYEKRLWQIFRISTPSPLKLGPKIGTEKSPKTDFSIFSSCVGRISFILHSQLEDHQGLLQ